MLASCIEFCLISHAATPDPPLVLFLTARLLLLLGRAREGDRRWWFVPAGAFAGLAVLTKGPIGVAMPGLVILLHLLWTRRLDKLWDRRLFAGAMAFIAVAAPWYIMVALDTKGKWLEAFVMNENLDRFQNPADGHRGQFYYHLAGLIVLFAPWCAFLLATFWYAVASARRPISNSSIDESSDDSPDKYRFLIVWFLAYLIFFSIAATKLPNYILPLYPALAILIAPVARPLAARADRRPHWMRIVTWLGGTARSASSSRSGFCSSAAWCPAPFTVRGFHPLPALGDYVLARGDPGPYGSRVRLARVERPARRRGRPPSRPGRSLLLAVVAAFPTVAMNEYKVPKHFAEEVGLQQTDKDIRIITCRWLRHSMVFYAQRKVSASTTRRASTSTSPCPAPHICWSPTTYGKSSRPMLTTPVKVIAKRYDFYSRHEILVIANQYAVPEPDAQARVRPSTLACASGSVRFITETRSPLDPTPFRSDNSPSTVLTHPFKSFR